MQPPTEDEGSSWEGVWRLGLIRTTSNLEEYWLPEEKPEEYFDAYTSGSQRIQDLVLFIKYLYESKGLSEVAMSTKSNFKVTL